MGIRYRVYDLPMNGVGAFCPIPAITPQASSHGVVKVTAALGRNPVPVDPPWGAEQVNDPRSQPSNNAPNIILYDTYIAYANGMGPVMDAGLGMATRRLCPLPVPARSWRLAVRPVFHRAIIGGRQAMPWPRAFQRF